MMSNSEVILPESSAALVIFICYSRRNTDLAEALVERLEAEGFKALIDRRDLPYGEEWQKELAENIARSDAVVWLVTPDSLASRWCRWELGEVSRSSKKLVPVLGISVEPSSLPEHIAKLQLLPSQGIFDFEQHGETLFRTLRTNNNWLRAHTRYSDLARQWAVARNSDLLLRGSALRSAESWQNTQPASGPAPSAEFLEYLTFSQRAERQRQRRLTIGAFVGAVAAAGLASVAIWQGLQASRNEAEARRQLQIAQVREASMISRTAVEELRKPGAGGAALWLMTEAYSLLQKGGQNPNKVEKENIEGVLLSAEMRYRATTIEQDIKGPRIGVRVWPQPAGGALIVDPGTAKGYKVTEDGKSEVVFASTKPRVHLAYQRGYFVETETRFEPSKTPGQEIARSNVVTFFDAEGKRKVWQVDALQQKPKIGSQLSTNSFVRHTAVSVDGKMLAVAVIGYPGSVIVMGGIRLPGEMERPVDGFEDFAAETDVQIFEVASNRVLRTFHIPDRVTALEFIDGGADILIASAMEPMAFNQYFDKNRVAVTVFDVTSGAKRYDLGGHKRGVTTIAQSKNKKQLATLDRAGEIFLWDRVDTTKPIMSADLSTMPWSAQFCHDDQHLLVSTEDGILHIWRTSGWRKIEERRPGDGGYLLASCAEAGTDVLASIDTGQMEIFTLSTAAPAAVFNPHGVQVRDLSFLSPSGRILSIAESGKPLLFDRTETPAAVYDGLLSGLPDCLTKVMRKEHRLSPEFPDYCSRASVAPREEVPQLTSQIVSLATALLAKEVDLASGIDDESCASNSEAKSLYAARKHLSPFLSDAKDKALDAFSRFRSRRSSGALQQMFELAIQEKVAETLRTHPGFRDLALLAKKLGETHDMIIAVPGWEQKLNYLVGLKDDLTMSTIHRTGFPVMANACLNARTAGAHTLGFASVEFYLYSFWVRRYNEGNMDAVRSLIERGLKLAGRD